MFTEYAEDGITFYNLYKWMSVMHHLKEKTIIDEIKMYCVHLLHIEACNQPRYWKL